MIIRHQTHSGLSLPRSPHPSLDSKWSLLARSPPARFLSPDSPEFQSSGISSHQVSQDIISPRLTYQQDIDFDHICFWWFPSKKVFPSKMKSITTVNITRHFLHHNASFPRPRRHSASRSFPMQKFCNSFTSASLSVVQVGCAGPCPGLAPGLCPDPRLAPTFP